MEATMIELTPEQRHAASQGEPVRVVDPATHDAYVLMRAEVFERLTAAGRPPVEEPATLIPPLVLRSQQAFWRDLPELLKKRRNRGKWAAYHGDERIGIAATDDELIRECIRRGLGNNDYYLDIIEPRPYPPWHVEEVHFGLAEYTDDPESPSP
jgi:hypothetical protein